MYGLLQVEVEPREKNGGEPVDARGDVSAYEFEGWYVHVLEEGVGKRLGRHKRTVR